MKIIYLLLGLSILVLTKAGYAKSLPGFNRSIKGTVLFDLVRRGDFKISGDEPIECERHGLPGLVSFNCNLTGTTATIEADGVGKSTFTFDRVRARIVSVTGAGRKMIFAYSGTYREKGVPGIRSDVALILAYFLREPGRITGSLELKDFGTIASIAATPDGMPEVP